MGYRDYAPAKGKIVDINGHGDFTTIGAAISASSSGQTIFISPGTYTENITLQPGVNLTAWPCDVGFNGFSNVVILGKTTYSSAGEVTISGIQLETNGDYCLSISGSSASVINVYNCYINASNHTGINITSSSSSSFLNLFESQGDTATTGISLFSHSGAGTILFQYCYVTNTGLSSTACTISSGVFFSNHNVFNFTLTSSSTSLVSCIHDRWTTVGLNIANMTLNGTGGTHFISNCDFFCGTASSISVGTGSTCSVINCLLSGTPTHAITGLGTVNYSGLSIPNGDINTSTINKLNFYAGTVV